MKIEKFDSLESTNKYCEALDLAEVEDFTCFWALGQIAGIGQRGNHWASAPGKNLTFSLVLKPDFLPAADQFRLTQALSLAICDCLAPCCSLKEHVSPVIKWPNDIYMDGGKICGTLVSTRLSGDCINTAICGIGLNVNQVEFPDWVPNPTSLALLMGRTYDLEPLLMQLLQHIEARYADLRHGIDPTPDYLALLMNRNVEARYLYEGEEITATITGIDRYGHLQLTAADGRRLSCAMKEIAFLL